MDANQLLASACNTTADYLALGNETLTAHGAVFVRNLQTPQRYDSNHVGLTRPSSYSEIAALLERAESEYAALAHRRFDCDPLTPPQFEATLALDGRYMVSETLWLLLEGDLHAPAAEHDLREAVSEEAWQAYRQLQDLDIAEYCARLGRPEVPAALDDSYVAKRLKSPPLRVWLAYAGDTPAGYFSSWPGANGIGMVEDLFVHPDYRHHGIATALIRRCVEDARIRGAGPVLIGADPHDTPKQMYATMGFRPLYVSRSYHRSASG